MIYKIVPFRVIVFVVNVIEAIPCVASGSITAASYSTSGTATLTSITIQTRNTSCLNAT
ncbi:MAG: hypothetical protein ACKPKO_13860 [Candidatus Fonsibacter sp.]